MSLYSNFQAFSNSIKLALSQKADKSELSQKADKSEIPSVPTNVSAFNNDAGYLTQHQDISGKENKGKMTLNNVEETVVTHTLSVTDGGVTTTYTLLGV